MQRQFLGPGFSGGPTLAQTKLGTAGSAQSESDEQDPGCKFVQAGITPCVTSDKNTKKVTMLNFILLFAVKPKSVEKFQNFASKTTAFYHSAILFTSKLKFTIINIK